ncbi:WD and tetratricopeptide repeats protein 1-like isoform X3 [Hibiscus syriacus]|uniref:WD and tetratricopeptide repeats protein 1-like isoform X3 n=1 Tax=Hibiscus syriacus TaxID=106335 RepID=UPI001924063D|nr:WD and tetratricopeptide repeats protein 1-like isoform X3 [Hibiscus syriacus]
MEEWPFHDGNICNLLDGRTIDIRQNCRDVDHSLHTHSSLIRRLALEQELEGHQGCVNAIAWNSNGSLLISGSDDAQINIWGYSSQKPLHSIETGHSANIFCTKFIPETSDELVASGAGDAEVRLFNFSRLNGRGFNDGAATPSALYQCHTRRVKKLAVEVGNPNVVWSASEDGTLRQHDLREGTSCPPAGSSHQECRNVLGPSSLHLTHVTFSPNGEEVLLSYSGEHVYLMDINHDSGSSMQYTSGDASKLMTFTPVPNKLQNQSFVSSSFENGLQRRSNNAARVEKCRMLVEIAKRSLEERTNIFHAIEACNEVLDGYSGDIDLSLRHECFCTRAALLLQRKWKNDAHMAIRDCHDARRIDNSSFRAHYCMAEALEQLGKHKEALNFVVAAQCLSPSDTMAAEKVENVKKHLAVAEAGKKNKASEVAPKSEPRTGRGLSLSDILYRSEANSDASQDGPRSDREDSDYDEEMELDFETSISGDEGQDVEPNMLHGSLNLRIHRRGDSTRETGPNGTSESPSLSSQNGRAAYQPEAVTDMKQRFVGHCNVGTDIKQASFLGQSGEYVASGSDDGRWFIWEKRTGRLIKMLLGDGAVVNCVQCHPFDCFVATSGIDNTIKLWSPTAAVPSMVAGGSAGPETSNVLEAMENNQRKLCLNREAILPFELLERLRMHEFTEGSLHPFECAQS